MLPRFRARQKRAATESLLIGGYATARAECAARQAYEWCVAGSARLEARAGAISLREAPSRRRRAERRAQRSFGRSAPASRRHERSPPHVEHSQQTEGRRPAERDAASAVRRRRAARPVREERARHGPRNRRGPLVTRRPALHSSRKARQAPAARQRCRDQGPDVSVSQDDSRCARFDHYPGEG